MSQPVPAPLPLDHLHAAFLSILPRIERHGRLAFRGLACPQSRDDALAEVVGLCWRWFVRLVGRGKDPLAFPAVLAAYAARHVPTVAPRPDLQTPLPVPEPPPGRGDRRDVRQRNRDHTPGPRPTAKSSPNR